MNKCGTNVCTMYMVQDADSAHICPTFVHCRFLLDAPVFAVAHHLAKIPPVAYYPSKGIATICPGPDPDPELDKLRPQRTCFSSDGSSICSLVASRVTG